MGSSHTEEEQVEEDRLGRPPTPMNFIRQAVVEDLRSGRFTGVHTRFPPEPNAYLHIGHAKAVWINFGIAQEFGGLFNLRFDDTNPTREEQEFVEAIVDDVRWLGVDWEDRLFFGSDYFEQQYEWALELINQGKAYVCDLSPEELIETRGTLTRPGVGSPYRSRSVDENLDLFQRMRAGEFPDGARTLRAKIDMAAPNVILRDPVMYRIRHAEHHRQGSKWCIYPMYDWFLDQLGIYHPRQMEFARLNMTHTVMSKRRFIELVEGGHVQGYDDPRLPTLAGLRRRGYTPESIREFCRRAGVAKIDNIVDVAVLEDCVRSDLNRRAPRVMAVLRPVKVVLTNYPEGRVEELDVINNPEDPGAGTRKVPFGRELYIERDDFREEPPTRYHRLAPGREVRLRNAYFVRCTGIVKNADGEITEIHCTYDPETRGGDAPDGRKVKATLHWVSVACAVQTEARLYGHLFLKPNPDDVEEGQDYISNLNPNSLEVVPCYVEPSVIGAQVGASYQFERLGYFCVDRDSTPERLCFNRTATLRDSWAKIEKAMKKD